MQVQCLSNRQRLTLDAAAMLGAGGEALVYTIPQDSALVAKVYRTPDKVQARKLAVMVTNPPDDPMGSHGHISIAWPVSLLELFPNKGSGRLSSQKAMEEANRWGCKSEMIVR
jgi:DNA-binding helix-hairpin-helix protein with protein kinase domain